MQLAHSGGVRAGVRFTSRADIDRLVPARGVTIPGDHQRPTLALLVKAAYRLGMREMNAALADLGLTAPQAEALAVLAQAGPLSLNQLGGLLIAEGGHPSRLVDRLVSSGWVTRQEAADDRRRVTLRLTAAGARLHAQAVQRTAPVFARLAERLEGQDVAAACAALAASLQGTDLAEVVSRRLADTTDTTTIQPLAPPLSP